VSSSLLPFATGEETRPSPRPHRLALSVTGSTSVPRGRLWPLISLTQVLPPPRPLDLTLPPLCPDSEGFITPASVLAYLGQDIDQNLLRQEIRNLKLDFGEGKSGGFISADGVGKS
jgi:hypothetical protein